MKVILLFALFGLSFYQASGNEDCPEYYKPDPEEYICKTSRVPYGDEPDCLAQAFHESAEFASAVGTFICEYNDCKSGRNTKNYEQAAKRFVYIVACLGCRLDYILGSGYSFEAILAEIAANVEEVGELIEKIVASLGIAAPVADALCLVVGKVLQSECVQDALGNVAPSIVHDLSLFYCKDDVSADEINSKIEALLDDVDCSLDLIAPSAGLGDLLRQLGDTSNCVLGCILNLTKKLPVVNTLLCTVLNGLLGDGGLLHGALDCLLGKGGLLSNILNWK